MVTVARLRGVARVPRGGKAVFSPHIGVMLSLPAAIILLAFFVWPILRVIALSFSTGSQELSGWTFEHYARLVTDSFYRTVAARSLLIALVITLFTVILGYPAAYFLIRAQSRLKHIFFVAMIAPLIISVVVRTLGWLMLLGEGGPAQQLLSLLAPGATSIQLLFNQWAVIVGMTHVLLPFMILTIAGTLAGVDRRVEEVARVLGASPRQVFGTVILPLSLPGVVAGSILVFSLALGAYLTPFFLGGGRVQTLATVIYDETLILIDWPQAAALSVLLLLSVLVLITAYGVFIGQLARRVA